MPELPDLAGYRRLIARSFHQLDRLELRDPHVARNADPDELAGAVEHRNLGSAERHGKWLVLRFDPQALLIHLGMTGSLVTIRPGEAPRRDDRAVLHGDADIALRDRRRLSGIWLAKEAAQIAAIIGALGPDAARITATELSTVLRHRRTPLKTALIDQTVIAGLGNTLSDEVLWNAHLHPSVRANALTCDDVITLHNALRGVVRRAARAGAIPRTSTWLTSQRSSADPRCPRCGSALRRSRVAGRTALWCPRCQPSLRNSDGPD